ncbi:MAG: hypothetical protein ABI699_17440 [Caldimonas sp.]
MNWPAWIGGVLLLATGACPAQPAVYRCGNEYTRVPCTQGKVVETENSATTTARRDEAAQVAARERTLADEMARDRRRAEAAIRPAGAASLGPRKAPDPEAKASASAKAKKKKKRAKTRPDDERDDFVAVVPPKPGK